MYDQFVGVVDEVLKLRNDNPDAAKGVEGALIGIGIFLLTWLVKWAKTAMRPLQWSEFGNTLMTALNSPTGWRWGLDKKKNKPTGRSIVYDLNGRRVVCDVKSGYFLGTDKLDKYLSKKERKALNLKRDEIIKALKENDRAAVQEAERKQREELLAKLTTATAPPVLASVNATKEYAKSAPKVNYQPAPAVKEIDPVTEAFGRTFYGSGSSGEVPSDFCGMPSAPISHAIIGQVMAPQAAAQNPHATKAPAAKAPTVADRLLQQASAYVAFLSMPSQLRLFTLLHSTNYNGRWRFGTVGKGAAKKPSGNSIVYEGPNGEKYVVNFVTRQFFVGGKEQILDGETKEAMLGLTSQVVTRLNSKKD